jgi:hypothetical protein
LRQPSYASRVAPAELRLGSARSVSVAALAQADLQKKGKEIIKEKN